MSIVPGQWQCVDGGRCTRYLERRGGGHGIGAESILVGTPQTQGVLLAHLEVVHVRTSDTVGGADGEVGVHRRIQTY